MVVVGSSESYLCECCACCLDNTNVWLALAGTTQICGTVGQSTQKKFMILLMKNENEVYRVKIKKENEV